jgi:hypothetical protein
VTFGEYTRHIDWSLTVGRRRTRQTASTGREFEGAQSLLEAKRPSMTRCGWPAACWQARRRPAAAAAGGVNPGKSTSGPHRYRPHDSPATTATLDAQNQVVPAAPRGPRSPVRKMSTLSSRIQAGNSSSTDPALSRNPDCAAAVLKGAFGAGAGRSRLRACPRPPGVVRWRDGHARGPGREIRRP